MKQTRRQAALGTCAPFPVSRARVLTLSRGARRTRERPHRYALIVYSGFDLVTHPARFQQTVPFSYLDLTS